MKTLLKFICPSVEIKLCMTSSKDAEFLKGTYKITETPRIKTTQWKEEIAYYDYNEDAREDYIKRINFWIK